MAMCVQVGNSYRYSSNKYDSISFEKRHRRRFPDFKNFVYENNVPCAYCGDIFEKRSDVTLEHVDDLFHGGRDNLDNIVAAHEKCNTRRGSVKNFIYYKDHPEIQKNFFNYLEKMTEFKPKGLNYSAILRKKLMKILSYI